MKTLRDSAAWWGSVLVFTLLLVAPSLRGQSDVRHDSAARFDHSFLTHHVEAGVNGLGIGLEYRLQWFKFLSTDALVSFSRPGAALGMTLSPLWIFFVQGVTGKGSQLEESVATDGPPRFNPDYLYGWNAGFRVPIVPKRTNLYFVLAVGQLKYVQNHYQYSGGGFIVGPPPPVLYRQESRSAEVYTIALGMSF